MIGVYVPHICLCLTIIRLSGDIEENPGFKVLPHIVSTELSHTTILKYPF